MVIGEARLSKEPVVSKQPACKQLYGEYSHPSLIPDHKWRKILTHEEYYVCRLGGTEPSFSGILTKFCEPGRYNCRCCGSDLFLSDQKYYSGCGWPVFSASYKADKNIIRVPDTRFDLNRTEVKCKNCNAHLGHVFEDKSTETGERYCINSVSINYEK